MRGVLTLAGVLLLQGCSLFSGNSAQQGREQALREMAWSFAEDAVELVISADPGLNTYDGQAHSLLLVVVQVQAPNAFSSDTANGQRLVQLLLTEQAPAGMLGLTRVFIEPGEQRRVRLPRLENSRYIGLASGYAHLDPARSARLYRIGVGITEEGFWSTRYRAAPEPIVIDLLLGADGILRGPGSRPADLVPEQPRAGEVRLAPSP